MTVVAVVGALDQGFKLRHVVRVRKIDNVNGNVVPLKTFAQVLTLTDVLLDWVTNEDNDALALGLIHTMLKRELGDLDSVKKVRVTV